MINSRGGMPLARLFVCVALASSPAVAQSGRMAQEVYQNIQVLEGIPADQLPATMQFVALSLGVGCSHCHVQGANEKDDKPQKKTARQMMQMVLATNRDNFDGRTEVTCYTCHRGNESPPSTPILSETSASPRPSDGETGGREPGETPSAEQLLDQYQAAMGGSDALSKIFSRVARGHVLAADGEKTAVEVFSKGGDAQLLITRTAEGDATVGYSGNSGWTSNTDRGPRDRNAADIEGSRLENDLYLARHAKQAYAQWRVGRSEAINGRGTYVLNGSEEGRAPVRLYLDSQTGLLWRVIHYTVTPLGRLPAQVDFADYRELNGVKVPYRMVKTRRNSSTTIQFDPVQQNVPVEDSIFSRPAAR